MKVLVTGASGLVGGRLIQYLSESGVAHVRAASRSERVWPNGVEGSVVDPSDSSRLKVACAGIDAVIHLASMSERACALNPSAALVANSGGTLAWALAAASVGVVRFVQVSTYKVYGNNPSGRVTEDTPSRPQSHYAITHRASEDYARAVHPNSVIFRLANGFGAPVDASADCWGIIVNEMCRQAVSKRKIEIRSSGLAWRNFVPMDHVVRALAAAATDVPAGLYNLGAAQSMTLRQVAERVADACAETMGFTPEVVTGSPARNEEAIALDYRLDKLSATGVIAPASLQGEIAATLVAARGAF